MDRGDTIPSKTSQVDKYLSRQVKYQFHKGRNGKNKCLPNGTELHQESVGRNKSLMSD